MSSQTSVTVNVAASANEGKFFDLQTAKNSIRIDCNGAAAVTSGGGSAPAGGNAGANTAPAGVIRGPDTGSGSFQVDGQPGGLDIWPLMALGLAAAVLTGLRFAARKIR